MSSDDHQYEHGPLPSARIARGEYDEAFRRSLEANGQLHAVPENWNGDLSNVPPQVTHVIHPNGDLERIAMT